MNTKNTFAVPIDLTLIRLAFLVFSELFSQVLKMPKINE